jgi:hypothetical protein
MKNYAPNAEGMQPGNRMPSLSSTQSAPSPCSVRYPLGTHPPSTRPVSTQMKPALFVRHVKHIIPTAIQSERSESDSWGLLRGRRSDSVPGNAPLLNSRVLGIPGSGR